MSTRGTTLQTPVWLRWTVVLVLLLGVAGAALAVAQRDPAAGAPSASEGSDPEGSAAGGAPAAGSGSRPMDGSGPVVSLTFNEGSPDLYRLVRPLLRSHGLNATFYVAPGRIERGEACCMTWDQLLNLYEEGHEIGGSGLDQVDLTVRHSEQEDEDHAYKQQQICEGHRLLAGHGLDPRSFAYPGGAYRYDFPSLQQSLTDVVAACGYQSARIVGGLAEQGEQASIALPPEQPYVLGTPSESGPAPLALADLQRPVVAAAEGEGQGEGRWVPLALNAVCHAGDPGYAACRESWRPVDDDVLDAFLAWLGDAGGPEGAPAGTTVQTVRQVMGAPPPPPLPAKTLVSLTFDDGDSTQALAADLLRSRDLRGTFFVNSGLVDAGNPYVMGWAKLAELQSQGHEIGGHTRDHVVLTDPDLPEAERREQVCEDRERLRAMGFDAVSFAYPEGGVDPSVEDIVRSCGYTSARSAGGATVTEHPYAETLPPTDPYATIAVDGPEAASAEAGSSEPLTLEGLRRAVVVADENGGGWVQFVLHRVCRDGSADFDECMRGTGAIDDETFTAFLDWLREDAPPRTRVATVQQAMVGEG